MDSEAIIDATRRRTAVRRQDQAAAGLRVPRHPRPQEGEK